LLLCEHPALITVGRAGSRAHIRLSEAELQHRRLAVRFVARGGGCVAHGQGQLAIYPIVSLERRGWSVGQYMRRLQAGVRDALAEMKYKPVTHPRRFGLWGRSGQLAAMGVAVRDWVALHGAFLNVSAPRGACGYVDVMPENNDSELRMTMGSLLSEHGRAVRMSTVRSNLVAKLADSFDCPRQHWHTGHPLLKTLAASQRE